ncbi:MAG: hypothetical protein ACLRTI_01900 [Blautia sp.]
MMNKKRLAALALSAVMAASTMSIPVYAADFSDGTTADAEVQVQSDFTADAAANSVQAETPAVEVTEDTAEEVGDSTQGTTIDESTIVFYYDDLNKGTVMEYKLKGNDKVFSVKAEKDEAKSTPATCTQDEVVWLKATVDGEHYYYSQTSFKGESALGESGHKWKVDYVYESGVPSHNFYFKVKAVYTCTVCNTVEEDEVKVEPIAHTWSAEPVYVPDTSYADPNVKTDDDGYVIFNEDGEAVLLDNRKDGHYEARWYCTDEACAVERREELDEGPAYRAEEKIEYAKTGRYAMITAYDTEHIATDLTGRRYYNPTQQLPLNEDDIELKDCRVGGWYTIEYFADQGTPDDFSDDTKLSEHDTITVEPHHYHVFTTAEFANATDAAQCTVSHDADGNLIVTNNNCSREVTYSEVSHCSADGCYEKAHEVKDGCEKDITCGGAPFFDKVEKTAEAADTHVIREEVYNEIERQMNDSKDSKLLTYARLLQTIVRFNAEDYVKLSAAPDCEVGGTVTVSYICILDRKTVVKTQEVKLVADEHVKTSAIDENIVQPTCDKAGSYDSVINCKYCGKELSREEKEIPRLTHTNEIKSQYDNFGIYETDKVTDTTAYLKFIGDKVVDVNGESLEAKGTNITNRYGEMLYAGTYAVKDIAAGFKNDFAVGVQVYTNCTECGKNEIALISQDKVALKIVDVQKESANGKAGSITLEATYKIQSEGENKGKTIKEEITVPYFSTIEAYNGRLEEQPETPEEKINGLHWDEDGECRYYVDGEFQKDFSGILTYEAGSFLLKDGVLCRTVSGLTPIDDEWYYLTEGRIRTDVTQVVMYDGEWFYVSEGKLDTSVNDLVPYDGETFVFVDGRLAQEGNGLWIGEEGVWYFLSNGRVAVEHTGLAMYDNEWFYVVDGKLAVDYSGNVEYNGATFKVDHGMLKGQVK